jgi:hypothetical protein
VSEEPLTDYVEHVSEIDGQRGFEARGTFWSVKIAVNLFKYSNPTTTFQAIIGFKGTAVVLYPHRDGREFQDILFILKEVKPFFLTTTDYKDGLMLEFESMTVVPALIIGRSITKTDPDGHVITDADGNPQLVWV